MKINDYIDEVSKCCELNISLGVSGLVMFTWGNISIISKDKKYVFIKPSGVPFKELCIDNISVVKVDSGAHVYGLKPSVDTPIHLSLYNADPSLKSICHNHSHFATVWAQSGKDLPILGTTHADYFPDKIPNIPIADNSSIMSYEKSIGICVSHYLKATVYDAAELGAVLLQSHGPLVFSNTIDDLLEKSIVLEEIASLAFHTQIIIEKSAYNLDSDRLFKFHYDRKHGKEKYYGQY